MTTFGLVHGGAHGQWQWGQLIAALDAMSLPSLTVELPITDPACGVPDYGEVAAEAFGQREDLVLVGHSMGGYVLPFIAERVPVKGIVFLSGTIQQGLFEGLPPQEGMLTIDLEDMPVGSDGLIRIADKAAEKYFYCDLPPSLRAWATGLLRPQSARALQPDRLPRIDNKTVSWASIVCSDDRALSPEWSRKAARDALGVEPYEIPGGHSPFLNRPHELAAILSRITRQEWARE